MSERDNDHFNLWLWIVIIAITVILHRIDVKIYRSELRDLQRRVAELEQRR